MGIDAVATGLNIRLSRGLQLSLHLRRPGCVVVVILEIYVL
jgi:hypothetical protein